MYSVIKISYEETKPFILNMHYLKRMPSISYSYGLFDKQDECIVGVVTFGKPASRSLCVGILGKQHADKIYELNRLILNDDLPHNSSSYLVGNALKDMKKDNLCIVSYSDLGMNHHGYTYQALNFMYTGTTKTRTDRYANGNHCRHYDKTKPEIYRVLRTSKNRYVYFNCNKRIKKIYMDCLNYEILDYPKGQNERYELGTKNTVYLKVIATGEIIKEKDKPEDNKKIIKQESPIVRTKPRNHNCSPSESV